MAGQRRRFTIYCSVMLVASAALVRALVLPIAVESSESKPSPAVPAASQPALPRADATDPKRLKALLAEAVGPLKQTDSEAGVRSIGEMRSTYAQGTFALDGKPKPATRR